MLFDAPSSPSLTTTSIIVHYKTRSEPIGMNIIQYCMIMTKLIKLLSFDKSF